MDPGVLIVGNEIFLLRWIVLQITGGLICPYALPMQHILFVRMQWNFMNI